jgi:hypothetical protein
MGTFERCEAEWLEPPDHDETGWSEDTVADVQRRIEELYAEPVYENGRKDDGISVRFLARLTMLRCDADLISAGDPIVKDAERVLGESDPSPETARPCPLCKNARILINPERGIVWCPEGLGGCGLTLDTHGRPEAEAWAMWNRRA